MRARTICDRAIDCFDDCTRAGVDAAADRAGAGGRAHRVRAVGSGLFSLSRRRHARSRALYGQDRAEGDGRGPRRRRQAVHRPPSPVDRHRHGAAGSANPLRLQSHSFGRRADRSGADAASGTRTPCNCCSATTSTWRISLRSCRRRSRSMCASRTATSATAPRSRADGDADALAALRC